MNILQPIVHETIWGGSKLTPYSGSTCTKIGHLYSAIDTPEFRSRIIAGPHAGQDLHEWFLAHRAAYGLTRYAELPILMALVEAADDLSIQVHPDDAMAAELEGLPFGKNESFYTLIPPTGGRMYNGCKAPDTEAMRRSIAEGRIAEMLDTMPCAAGDYVYIEGGTLHAATAGSLHFEIEENCERTYRFWDYDRTDARGNKRPLQLDKALACLRVEKKSRTRRYSGDTPIEERLYSTRLIEGKSSYTHAGDMFGFAVMLRGEQLLLGTRILPGTAILLDPGDTLDTSGATYIIATPKR